MSARSHSLLAKLTLAGSLAVFFFGCERRSEFSRVFERAPDESDRSCVEICESVLVAEDDHDVDFLECQEVKTLEGAPAVACFYELCTPTSFPH